MQYNSKATPKSCGCQACKRARSTQVEGKKKEERAFRHAMNRATEKQSADVLPAGSRNRNG